jgi:hypothetical protein
MALKLSLCLTKHHAVKTYVGMEVWLHPFLTSALDGDEWSASRPRHFTCGERAPGAYRIGGWVGPRASLDAEAKRKKSVPLPGIEPSRPTRSLVTIPTELSQLWQVVDESV